MSLRSPEDPRSASNHPHTVADRVTTLEDDLTEMKTDMKELLELFKGAQTVLAIVKWLGTLAIAVTTLYYMIINSIGPLKPPH